MNQEKLDDLAIQAGFDVKRLRAPYPGGFPREDMLALESFAELIVRECMELTHWQEFDMCVEQRIRMSVAQDIKEHFGVEE